MPKYATVAIDSAGELARLYFSRAMQKTGKDMDKIRAMNHYPDATERMNMLVRSIKQKRDAGCEIVFTAHEDIEKVYAKGSGMAAQGQPAPEPIAVKGWPDIPGRRAPDEFCRAVDNVIRVRRWNQGGVLKPCWVTNREAIGVGAEYWEVKDRFNGPACGGLFDADYEAVKKAVVAKNPEWWQPPYIWMLYGPFGIGKTRSLLTFPKPILLFDLDLGTKSLTATEIKSAQMTIEKSINVEDHTHYSKFTGLLEAAF